MFHCGSRGFGHQVATDYLQVFLKVMESKYGIKVLDRELACAPFESPEGRDYFAAMKCGLNMAFANRQVILHRIREVFSEIFGRSAQDLGMRMIYDVAHNTAKLEKPPSMEKSAPCWCIVKEQRERSGPATRKWPRATGTSVNR